MSLNNDAWKILFDRHHILEEINKTGMFEISAAEIKTIREPRLMAKFDHEIHLPTIFKKNQLSILPITRSSYVIGKFKAYQELEHTSLVKPKQMKFPAWISTIKPSDLYSESVALHCAYLSGMIDDIMGEKTVQTISGRMSSKQFTFEIDTALNTTHKISINKSQLEIDGGYESLRKFMIVEAKKTSVEDFLIRQMYFPYRLWKEKTHKEIVPVFFTHSNDIFNFYKYSFEEPNKYNSLKLIEHKQYILEERKITMKDIIGVYRAAYLIDEPQTPFPQADTFPRIIDLMGLLMENDMSIEAITSSYNFDRRQALYYTSAGIYLGLIDTNRNDNLRLSELGREILGLSVREKYLNLVKQILSHRVFYLVFEHKIKMNNRPLERTDVVKIMKECNLYNINSEVTLERRASTIISWINWIWSLPKIY